MYLLLYIYVLISFILFFNSFFKYKFSYFNWRLITLQYCIGFAIHQHESATGIHVFPILNPPPASLPIPSLWVVPVWSLFLSLKLSSFFFHLSMPLTTETPFHPSFVSFAFSTVTVIKLNYYVCVCEWKCLTVF